MAMAVQALEAGGCFESPVSFCFLCQLSRAGDGAAFHQSAKSSHSPGAGFTGGSDRQIQ